MQYLGYLGGPEITESSGCGPCRWVGLPRRSPFISCGIRLVGRTRRTGWLLDADGEDCGVDRSAIAVR
jgi:hypothetical protein